VSAILRLRNEDEYLERALASIQPFFDEFIIVYNRCTDRTPDIIESFAHEEKSRVRAFHYVPEVFPPATDRYAATPPDDASSIVHYYNFALSKVSYRICLKWDGDMIAAPGPLSRVMKRLRGLRSWMPSWWFSPWKRGWWWFSGVNLWDRDGKIFVPKTHPRTYGKDDHGFWPVGPGTVFKYDVRCEFLDTGRLLKTFVGFMYFHLKGMKRDRGVGGYQESNTYPVFMNQIKELWTNPELMTFEEYCRIEPAAGSLPDPESLGIRPLER
jgi:glycosyltransferase involved in cell wall biosynthesis